MENANRRARRAARTSQNSKRLAAVSILASSSLISGYLAVVRPDASFATGSCELNINLSSQTFSAFMDYNQRLLSTVAIEQAVADAFLDTSEGGTGEFVSEFTGGNEVLCEELVLNFTETNSSYTTFFLDDDLDLGFSNVDKVNLNFSSAEGFTIRGQSVSGDAGYYVDGYYDPDTYENVEGYYYEDSYTYDQNSSPIHQLNFSYATELAIDSLSIIHTNGLVISNVVDVALSQPNFSYSESNEMQDSLSSLTFFPTAFGETSLLGSSLTITEGYFGSSEGVIGGAVSTNAETLTVSYSDFDSNHSYGSDSFTDEVIAGGAIYMGGVSATITDSMFRNNSTLGYGGAIGMATFDPQEGSSLTVERSSFFDNRATDNYGGDVGGIGGGGAIAAFGDVEIRGSLFDSNFAYVGGAINSYGGEIDIENNTFVDNGAYAGGAILSLSDTNRISFSTFIDNDANSNGDTSLGDSIFGLYPQGQAFSINANIFADSLSSSEGGQIRFGENLYSSPENFEFGYNVLTLNEFYSQIPEENLELGTNKLVAFEDLFFANEENYSWILGDNEAIQAENITWVSQTVAIQSGSAAQNIVPTSLFDAPTIDQRGLPRRTENGFLDAGAFEIQEVGPLGNGSSALMDPVVIDVNPKRIDVRDEIVTVTGAVLAGVTKILVGGKEAKLVKATNNRITFRVPAGLTGLQTLELYFPGKTITLKDALRFVTASQLVKSVIRGFAPNSARLTRNMKREIRQFISQNPELTTVVCKGFTSAPITAADKTLATKRGQVVCRYIEKKFPNLTTEAREGSHTSKPGSAVRRVRLILQ